MTKKCKSSAFNVTEALKLMAKINTTKICHDKAIHLIGKGFIVGKHTDITMQMDSKLFTKLAPSGGHTCTAAATIVTAACAIFIKMYKKSCCEARLKRTNMELWAKELHKMHPNAPYFQDQDKLNLLSSTWNTTLCTFA